MPPRTGPWTRPTCCAARWVGRELVVVHCVDGRLVVLNETGGNAWLLADGRRDADALARALAELDGRTGPPPPLAPFLAELTGAGLLTPTAAGDAPPAAGPPLLPPEGEPPAPALVANEPLETLAGGCDSAFGIFSQCQLQGVCFDPQF